MNADYADKTKYFDRIATHLSGESFLSSKSIFVLAYLRLLEAPTFGYPILSASQLLLLG
jgi:hypothetical protein